MWVVKLTNPYQDNDVKILKRYPFKLQCIIWCYLKGFVVSGGADFYPYKHYSFLCYWPASDGKLTIEEEA